MTIFQSLYIDEIFAHYIQSLWQYLELQVIECFKKWNNCQAVFAQGKWGGVWASLQVCIPLIESKIFKSVEYFRRRDQNSLFTKFYQPLSHKCHGQESRQQCYIWCRSSYLKGSLRLDFHPFWIMFSGTVCEESCVQLGSFVCLAPSKVANALARRRQKF